MPKYVASYEDLHGLLWLFENLLTTVKVATLIYISWRSWAISSANGGKSDFIYKLVKEIISCLSVQTCAYFKKIVTVYTLNSYLFTLKAPIQKSHMFLSSAEIF